METRCTPSMNQGTDKQASSTQVTGRLQENCENCQPLSPLKCVNGCKIWRLKNELRTLRKRMEKPDYLSTLFNTLKNKRRLQVLAMISRGQSSIEKMQKELKKSGYYHSQETIIQEYVQPLLDAGIAQENGNQYRATVFGCSIYDTIRDFMEIGDVLPPHSECFEEQTLHALLESPRTYEDLKTTIPSGSIARILSRLQMKELMNTNKEKDYIFFFKTQRNPGCEKLSSTEKKVYASIPREGISAHKLTAKARISLRRTYKYLKRLKGKKLVFTRKRPRNYTLTDKGAKVATTLEKISRVVAKTADEITRFIEKEGESVLQIPSGASLRPLEEESKMEPPTTIRYFRLRN